jgi:hypothetical protein
VHSQGEGNYHYAFPIVGLPDGWDDKDGDDVFAGDRLGEQWLLSQEGNYRKGELPSEKILRSFN